SAGSRKGRAGSLCSPESEKLRLRSMPARRALSFHSVECFLENFDIARATNLFSGGFNPLLFESVFSRAIGFVEYAEHSGERELREFVRCELVSDVVP